MKNNLEELSIMELSEACARQSAKCNRDSDLKTEDDPCYHMFRFAIESPPCEEAWRALMAQYHREIRLWLNEQASDETVHETFVRFWMSQRSEPETFTERFPKTGHILAYIKQCAFTVKIKARREKLRRQKLQNRLETNNAFQSHNDRQSQEAQTLVRLVRTKLKDEEEEAVFELTYTAGKKPREIFQLRPDLFPKIKHVYRVKERFLKRLRRDEDLDNWWHDAFEL